jgi:protein-tyrosine phosphatase
MIRGVLFVCAGNLCRSPMAEGLLRHAMPAIRVSSAGTHARAGMPADAHAVAVMHTHGIDISTHRAQPLSSALCAGHELVLVMDQPLRQLVLSRYPMLRGRVHLLAEAGIDDPYQQPYDVFVDCHGRVAAAIAAWQPRLHALAGAAVRDVS